MNYNLELYKRILALEKWATAAEELASPPNDGMLSRLREQNVLEQTINAVAKGFPEIVGISHEIGTDASGADCLDVRVLLTDEAATGKFLGSITRRISDSLTETISLRDNWPLQVYTHFRSASEQATLNNPDWPEVKN